MKMYYFEIEFYGDEYHIMADSKCDALEYLRVHFINEINDKIKRTGLEFPVSIYNKYYESVDDYIENHDDYKIYLHFLNNQDNIIEYSNGEILITSKC